MPTQLPRLSASTVFGYARALPARLPSKAKSARASKLTVDQQTRRSRVGGGDPRNVGLLAVSKNEGKTVKYPKLPVVPAINALALDAEKNLRACCNGEGVVLKAAPGLAKLEMVMWVSRAACSVSSVHTPSETAVSRERSAF